MTALQFFLVVLPDELPVGRYEVVPTLFSTLSSTTLAFFLERSDLSRPDGLRWVPGCRSRGEHTRSHPTNFHSDSTSESKKGGVPAPVKRGESPLCKTPHPRLPGLLLQRQGAAERRRVTSERFESVAFSLSLFISCPSHHVRHAFGSRQKVAPPG